MSKNVIYDENRNQFALSEESENDGTVDWAEVTDKPTFADVATSGDYNDLLNKPSAVEVGANLHLDDDGKIQLGNTTNTNFSKTRFNISISDTGDDLGSKYNVTTFDAGWTSSEFVAINDVNKRTTNNMFYDGGSQLASRFYVDKNNSQNYHETYFYTSPINTWLANYYQLNGVSQESSVHINKGIFRIGYDTGGSDTHLKFDKTENLGIVAKDQNHNIGLSYEDDYSTIGKTMDRWIPDWGAVKSQIDLRVPVPPATGHYRLESVDGVVSWVEVI